MIYHYDLHIHSVLSACADDLMTPNNIFNMANLKGLNIISVTDHNSLKQLQICQEISESYDMLFIPGVEISVSEGFHVLCYFKKIEQALNFDKKLERYIKKSTYDEQLYGEQQIVDINDQIIDLYPYLLSPSLSINLEELKQELKGFEYLLFYAHVDRKKNSGLANIEIDPLNGIEISVQGTQVFIQKNHLDHQMIIFNSDAHQIIDILEKTSKNQIELDELSIEAFFRYFNHG